MSGRRAGGCAGFQGRVEQAFAEAAAAAGHATDDTRIVYQSGSDVMHVGGRRFTFARLRDDGYAMSPRRSSYHPARWPRLRGREALIHAGPEPPSLAVTVFSQTAVVSTAERRRELFDAAWQHLLHLESDLIHASETSDPHGALTCWSEVMRGITFQEFPPAEAAVILVGGPAIASWGVVVAAPPWYPEMVAFARDLVGAVCDAPPGDG